MRWQINHLLATALLTVAAVTISAATRTWDGPGSATGDWDIGVTANWSGGNVYVDGDDVRFNGSIVKFRNTTSTADITVAGVAPGSIVLYGGYGGRWQLTGGDVGGSTGIDVGQDNRIVLSRDGSYSFAGALSTVASNGRGAITISPQLSVSGSTVYAGSGDIEVAGGDLEFYPSQTATLGNTVLVLASPNPSKPSTIVRSNSNAEWSGIELDAGATLRLDLNLTMNGAAVTLLGDATLEMRTRGSTYFNGTAGGAYELTLSLPNEGYSQYATVGGSGNWTVGSVRKTGTATLRVDAPNICGSGLHIDAGKVQLNNAGITETVTALSLGGVVQEIGGTYGSSSSGADNVSDTYFSGPGQVDLQCVPCLDFVPAILEAICAAGPWDNAGDLETVVEAAIADEVSGVICATGPGGGSAATCEAYIQSVLLADDVASLLGQMFQ